MFDTLERASGIIATYTGLGYVIAKIVIMIRQDIDRRQDRREAKEKDQDEKANKPADS